MLLALLVIAPIAVYAGGEPVVGFGHSNPGPWSNNVGTYWQGHLHGTNPNNNGYWASGEYIQWSPGAIDWVRANNHENRYQPAIVFHAFDKTRGGCSLGYYSTYGTNLPGNWWQRKAACFSDRSEARIAVGLPWELGEGVYYAQAYWVDESYPVGYTVNEINIDNYWIDSHSSWEAGTKDNMAKFCLYRNYAYAPNGPNWTCVRP
jgi:hypothetical protein